MGRIMGVCYHPPLSLEDQAVSSSLRHAFPHAGCVQPDSIPAKGKAPEARSSASCAWESQTREGCLGKVASEPKSEGGWIRETGSSALAARGRVRGVKCLEPSQKGNERTASPATSRGTIGDLLQVKSGCALGNFLRIW